MNKHDSLAYPVVEIKFYGQVIVEIPVFLLGMIKDNTQKNIDQCLWYKFSGNTISRCEQEKSDFVAEVRRKFSYKEISTVTQHNCSLANDFLLNSIWSGVEPNSKICLKILCIPDKLYKYMNINSTHYVDILKHGKLTLQPPSVFNDPWDCNYDKIITNRLLDVGISCFSEDDKNILMYSHYSRGHTGICIEFDTERMRTMYSAESKKQVKSSIRPVFYYKQPPNFEAESHAAAIATCKNYIWRHEKEWRVFAVSNGEPLSSGSYIIDRNAITSVFFGCKVDDKNIGCIKNLLDDLKDVSYKRARTPNGNFSIVYDEC